MELKIYEFTASDIQHGENRGAYTFDAYELPTGEAMVPGTSTNDSYFDSIDSVEPNGNDEIVSCNLTTRTVEFTEEEIRESINGSAREFGKEAIPVTLQQWLSEED